jgi:hypothetical protein
MEMSTYANATTADRNGVTTVVPTVVNK